MKLSAGPLFALAAAALFGSATPAAKTLLGSVDPWLMAGLLYTGSGAGLSLVWLSKGRRTAEAGLARADLPWLAGAILFGGVLAPVLLMIGLSHTEASTASLLLTLEGTMTALLAWFVFRENFDRRIMLGMTLIVAGALVLVWQDGFEAPSLIGPLAVVAACAGWAIDNNLTRRVALADPVQIAMLKGICAGATNLALAFAFGRAQLPPVSTVALASLVGFFGYGVSLVLFVLALRYLGTARTGAYFSTAPFIGAAVAIPMLGEPLMIRLAIAGVLMAAGVWLHLTESHEHEHDHQSIEHSHGHVHDEHHQHAHGPGDPRGEPHTHRHAHTGLRHTHAHVPDSHHRHLH